LNLVGREFGRLPWFVLSREGSVSLHRWHLLGRIATEQFVVERLLPMLLDAKPPLLQNIQKVIKQAGSRHGHRYLPELLT